MAAHGLPKSLSSKTAASEKVTESLEQGRISYDQIVSYLDSIVPWGKQHVFLFDGPGSRISDWKSKSKVVKRLSIHAPEFHDAIGVQHFVGMPEKLTPTSVEVSTKLIRLNLVRRREWWEPTPELNKKGKTKQGEEIDYRAFVHKSIRSYVAFEWDLVLNKAMLQISQLQGQVRYENVKQEFSNLVAPWLDLSTFSLVDMHGVILKLLDLERKNKAITRAHGFDIHSQQGRSISARSGLGNTSVFGEASVDAVFDSMSKRGVGNNGNFFWIPKSGNPLSSELRVVIVGSRNRVNFTSPSDEKTVRHVLVNRG